MFVTGIALCEIILFSLYRDRILCVNWATSRHAIYIYNSVLTRRHRHINSSASTPPNATKIAKMKVSHHWLEIVGPELLFSIYKCCFLEFVCAR